MDEVCRDVSVDGVAVRLADDDFFVGRRHGIGRSEDRVIWSSGFEIARWPDHPMSRFFLIFALPEPFPSGIHLNSSQNNNVMLFFVVRSIWRDETILLIYKHLHPAQPRISTDCGKPDERFTSFWIRSRDSRCGVAQSTTQHG
jgi:hypothetical protein